jgi:hypothetical protein
MHTSLPRYLPRICRLCYPPAGTPPVISFTIPSDHHIAFSYTSNYVVSVVIASALHQSYTCWSHPCANAMLPVRFTFDRALDRAERVSPGCAGCVRRTVDDRWPGVIYYCNSKVQVAGECLKKPFHCAFLYTMANSLNETFSYLLSSNS